MEMTMKKKL